MRSQFLLGCLFLGLCGLVGFTHPSQEYPQTQQTENQPWRKATPAERRARAVSILRLHHSNENFQLSDVWWPTQGGRSWTIDDEIGFSNWLQDDSAPKNDAEYYTKFSNEILNRWLISHDCADAMYAVRWIYALLNGLALRFTETYSTAHTKYKNDPVALIEDTGSHLPAQQNVINGAYVVDITQAANFKAGLMVDSGNHVAMLKSALKPDGSNQFYFRMITSNSPIDEQPFSEYVYDYTTSRDPEFKWFNFGRFLPVKNEKGVLSYDYTVVRAVFPADDAPKPSLSHQLLVNCGDPKKDGGAQAWLNLSQYMWALQYWPEYQNEASRSDAIRQCLHNRPSAVDALRPPLDVKALYKQLSPELCAPIQARAKRVVSGFERCRQGQSRSFPCSTGVHDPYSTYRSDYVLSRNVISMVHVARAAGLSNSEIEQQSCQIDLLEGMQDPDLFKRHFVNQGLPEDQANELLSQDSTLRFRRLAPVLFYQKWMHFLERGHKNSDPIAGFAERWGCSLTDFSLSCLN